MNPVVWCVGEKSAAAAVPLAAGETELSVSIRTVDPEAFAFDDLESEHVDVLVCGYELAGKSGGDLVAAVRQRRPLLPVIFVTDRSKATVYSGENGPTAHVDAASADAGGRLAAVLTDIIAVVRGGTTVPERRADAVLERVSDAFYALDDEWQFVYLNSRAEELLEQPAAALLGESVWEAFPEAAETLVYSAYHRAMETGERVEFELYFEPLERWFEISAYPSRTGLSVYFRDVTVDIFRTQAVREANVGVVITDPQQPDNPIVYVNEGFTKLTGYSERDAVGRNCRVLQGPATDDEPVAKLRAAIDAEETVETDILNYRKSGIPFWNHIQVTPITDASGDVTHFVGFQNDATDRVEQERRTALLHRVLRHNLRNELMVIRGNVNIARKNTDDAAAFEAAVAAIDRLLTLGEKAREVESLLDDRSFEPEVYSIGRLLDEPLAAVAEAWGPLGIEHDIDDNSEVLTTSAVVPAFHELFENAAKHGCCEPLRLAVNTTETTESFPPGGDERAVVQIEIADCGPPISDLDVSVLLGREETPLQHGTGIGLWLVNWLVAMSGGRVAYRRADSGNVITVTLPKPRPEAAKKYT